MATTTLLKGHGLVEEGWPFIGTQVRARYRGSPGMGKCSCGEMSEMLPSTVARKRWHREHKDKVRAAIAAEQ